MTDTLDSRDTVWVEHEALIDRVPRWVAMLALAVVVVAIWDLATARMAWVSPIILPSPGETLDDLIFVGKNLLSGGTCSRRSGRRRGRCSGPSSWPRASASRWACSSARRSSASARSCPISWRSTRCRRSPSRRSSSRGSASTSPRRWRSRPSSPPSPSWFRRRQASIPLPRTSGCCSRRWAPLGCRRCCGSSCRTGCRTSSPG